jgi:hypothetical protein
VRWPGRRWFGDVVGGGKFVHVDEMVIFRIADGKIVEAWEVYDEAGMRRQFGTSAPHITAATSSPWDASNHHDGPWSPRLG